MRWLRSYIPVPRWLVVVFFCMTVQDISYMPIAVEGGRVPDLVRRGDLGHRLRCGWQTMRVLDNTMPELPRCSLGTLVVHAHTAQLR
jgi:hypothetical protein